MRGHITGSARGAGTPRQAPPGPPSAPGPTWASAAPSRRAVAAGIVVGVTANTLGTERAGDSHISSPQLEAWPLSHFAVPVGPISLHGGRGGGPWTRTVEQTLPGVREPWPSPGGGHLGGAGAATLGLSGHLHHPASSSPPCSEQGGPCPEVAGGEQEGATTTARAICDSRGAELSTPAASPARPHQSPCSELTSQPGPRAR